MKNAKGKFNILHNRNGYTMIEAITVIAIIAIISVIIGSFVLNISGVFYKEKDIVASKDISKIIEKEIRRLLIYKEYVYLQNINTELNGDILVDIPGQDFVNVGGVDFDPQNKPSKEADLLYSDPTNGIVMFNDGFYDESISDESYFGNDDNEIKAFYNNVKVDLYFKALGGGNGMFQSIIVFADIKNSKNEIIYKSEGTTIELKNLTKTGNGINANQVRNYNENEFIAYGTTYNYKNLINGESIYTCILFA